MQILVTGACGQIGRELCRQLASAGMDVVPVDVSGDARERFIACDVRQRHHVAELFVSRNVRCVIHLAGVLPSAFRADPLLGAEVNVGGTLNLLRESINHRVGRFVFASSLSVYRSSARLARELREDDLAVGDEPYGVAKRLVEVAGETLAKLGAIEFVSLRIARVVGPGVKRSRSPWRSQMFEPPPQGTSIRIPFAPDALLSLVHVQDVARMFVTLATSSRVSARVYNTPAETWKVGELRELIEKYTGALVELTAENVDGGPLSDGAAFAQEFGFQPRGVRSSYEALSVPLSEAKGLM